MANLGLLSILNYDKQKLMALASLRSVKQTHTDIKNKELEYDFVKDNMLGTDVSSRYYIPDYLYKSKSKTYSYDPRLTLGIYLNHITNEYRKFNDIKKIKVPFSWYDWTDLGKDLNKLIDLPQKFKPDCSYVCTNYFNKQLQRELEEKIKGTFVEKEDQEDTNNKDGNNKSPPKRKRKSTKYQMQKYSYCKDDNSDSQPGFRIFKNHLKSKPDVKSLQSKSFLYSEASAPISLVFLTENGNVQVETIPNEDNEDKQQYSLVHNKLIQNYVNAFKKDDEHYKEEIYVDSQQELQELFETMGPLDTTTPRIPLDTYSVELNESLFVFDGPGYLKSHNPSNRHEQIFHDSITKSLQTKELLIEKYFEEVLLSRTKTHLQGGHFDWRFFSGDINQEDREMVLSRLLSNWFKLTNNAGLFSWIAHGNLLAYSFNGLNFPWDDDIDVQMPFADLAKLAERFNQSLIIEDPEEGYGRFFIDVSSSLTHRISGNNNNHIDARFIDVDTGLFIDITALAVSSADTSMRFKDRLEAIQQKGLDVQHEDPNIFEGIYDDLSRDFMRKLAKENLPLYKQLRLFERESKHSRGKLLKDKSPAERYDLNYKMQAVNCRNNHFVSLDELSPLKRSFYEKIPIFVPHNVTAILLDEYKPQRKLSAQFHDHTYLPQLRLWIPNNILTNVFRDERQRRDYNMLSEADMENLLKEESVLVEYSKTFDATLIREKEKEVYMDENIKDKDEILSKLIIGKKFPTLRKDRFMSRLEKEAANHYGLKLDKDLLQSKMIDQLHLEFSKQVDYNVLGSNLPVDGLNFNNYGVLYKDILKKVREEHYEPDFEMKKQEIEESVRKARNNIDREARQKELNELLDNEIKSKFDKNTPKPKMILKGQNGEIPPERPPIKPAEEDQERGQEEGTHDFEGKPIDPKKQKEIVEAEQQKAGDELPQIEIDPIKEAERLQKIHPAGQGEIL